MPEVSIQTAADHFNVRPDTVRRWIRQGAPCASPGATGPGRGAQVVIEDLARWRVARLGVVGPDCGVMGKIERALHDVLRRDGGGGRPVWLELGISAAAVAELIAAVHKRLAREFNSDANT